MYDLKNWNLPWLGSGRVLRVRLDAKPADMATPDAYYDPNYRLKESSYSLDAIYTLQEGRAKGTMFKLHFTQYDNHSDIPSYAGGYGNIFQL